MNKYKIKISWLNVIGCCLIILLAYIGGLSFVYSHENVHSEIYKTYNITSEISINYFLLSGMTSVSLEDYKRCDASCRMSHDLTESIGYQIEALIVNLWALLGVYMIWRGMHG